MNGVEGSARELRIKTRRHGQTRSLVVLTSERVSGVHEWLIHVMRVKRPNVREVSDGGGMAADVPVSGKVEVARRTAGDSPEPFDRPNWFGVLGAITAMRRLGGAIE
jgi:hypothetical protein